MSTCCETPDTVVPRSGELTIALAGNPNSGKTTLFNALTGLRQKVANYPGVTVEKKTGRCKLPDGKWSVVIDLPGTYSLISRSPDEHVAMEVLRGLRPDTPAPDVVVVVVDASNLQRNLYLVSQLIELRRPMVVALNMMDIAERRGLRVSPVRLAKELGVPVVPVVGHRKQGIAELKQEILHARIPPLPDFPLPRPMHDELIAVGSGLAAINGENGKPLSTSPETDGEGHRHIHLPLQRVLGAGGCRADDCKALAERLMIGDRAPDVAAIADTAAVAKLLDHAHNRLSQLGIDPMQADIEAHYRWIDEIAAGALEPACAVLLDGQDVVGTPEGAEHRLDYASRVNTLTEGADHILLHKVWGLVVFAGIMGALFVAIFWLAGPLMDGMVALVERLGDFVANRMNDGPLKDLWTDGIVAGVGGVVVFVPQIAILFLFLAILEDSGYLARAAFLMDRVLSKVGLHGKSFIPMLSSFACAIPGIMATRTIENRQDRLATIFVAPFMSCSARIPVYTLLIGTFFGGYSAWVQGGIMFAMYVIGVLAAVVTAFIFKRTLLKGAPTSFILELPAYKIPQWDQVGRVVFTNTKAFVVKAGTIIFALSVILWAMTYYPRIPAAQEAGIRQQAEQSYWNASSEGLTVSRKEQELMLRGLAFTYPNSNEATNETIKRLDEGAATAGEEAVASEQLRQSVAGRFGHVIEPVIQPLGYDWKMGVGLVGSFAAREVFVSTMGIVYSAGDTEESTASLEEQMRSDTYPDGRPRWTPLVAVSLLVWFVLAMQCMSTLAIVKRETGGWLWPLGMLLYMNALAWVVCFGIYQVGKIWFA